MFFATSAELTRSAHSNALGLLRPIHERAATAYLHAPSPAKTLLHSGDTLILFILLKLAIHLSFLAFWHIRALFREIANQSLYTFHNIADFGHLWFYEKLDKKHALSSSLTFCENTDRLARMAKCEMRKMVGEMVYEMPSIHFSFLSFCQHFFAFSSISR